MPGEGAQSGRRVPGPRLWDLAGDLRLQPGSPNPVLPSGLGTSHTSFSLLCIRGEKAGSLWRADGDPDHRATASSRRRSRGQLPSGKGLLHPARCRPCPGAERCKRPALVEGPAATPRKVWGAKLTALCEHRSRPCVRAVGRPAGRVGDVGSGVPELRPARQAEAPGRRGSGSATVAFRRAEGRLPGLEVRRGAVLETREARAARGTQAQPPARCKRPHRACGSELSVGLSADR